MGIDNQHRAKYQPVAACMEPSLEKMPIAKIQASVMSSPMAPYRHVLALARESRGSLILQPGSERVVLLHEGRGGKEVKTRLKETSSRKKPGDGDADNL